MEVKPELWGAMGSYVSSCGLAAGGLVAVAVAVQHSWSFQVGDGAAGRRMVEPRGSTKLNSGGQVLVSGA